MIEGALIEQNVDQYASIFLTFSQIKQFAKKKLEVQQTVFGKPADSFKLAWFTLPDSFKIPQNPCQTVLSIFGTPELQLK